MMQALLDLFNSRWPSFSPHEVLSPGALALYLDKGVFIYSFKALDTLQTFRNTTGPLRLNRGPLLHRGARTPQENFEVQKGVGPGHDAWQYSFHLWGAFDIDSPTLSCESLFEMAINSKLWGGVGIYNTWVHVDIRDLVGRDIAQDGPITWDLRTGKARSQLPQDDS